MNITQQTISWRERPGAQRGDASYRSKGVLVQPFSGASVVSSERHQRDADCDQ